MCKIYNVNELWDQDKVLLVEGWRTYYDGDYNYYLQITPVDKNSESLKGLEEVPAHSTVKDGWDRGIRISSRFTYDGVGGCPTDSAAVEMNTNHQQTVYVKNAMSAYIYALAKK